MRRRALLAAALSLASLSAAVPAAGSLAETFERLEHLSAAGQYEAALALGEALLRPTPFDAWRRELEESDSLVLAPLLRVAEPWIESFGLSGLATEERAAVHYAAGVIWTRRGGPRVPPSAPAPGESAPPDPAREARENFERTVGLASGRELRGDASYNVATLALLEGEAWRALIPEISGQAPPPAGGDEDEGPEPLEEARAAYEEARDLFITRLRLDWRDADSRANLELCLRRLEELDEIERQREEQERDDQEEPQDPQDQEDQQDQQDQQEGDDEQDQQGEGDPEDQQDPEDSQPEDEDSPEEPEGEEPREPEQDPEAPDEGQSEEQEAPREAREEFLTREEVQRLLDKLAEHERIGEELRARERERGRSSTARDW